jgi:circadian clock protein KaiB
VARQHVAGLCEQDLNGRCRVEVVDVLEDFQAAAEHSILLMPILLRPKPEPVVRLIGKLSDREKVHTALPFG